MDADLARHVLGQNRRRMRASADAVILDRIMRGPGENLLMSRPAETVAIVVAQDAHRGDLLAFRLLVAVGAAAVMAAVLAAVAAAFL